MLARIIIICYCETIKLVVMLITISFESKSLMIRILSTSKTSNPVRKPRLPDLLNPWLSISG